MKKYIPLLILLSLGATIYFTGIWRHFTFENLKNTHDTLTHFVNEHNILAPITFNLIYIVTTVLCIPSCVFLSLLGGFLFPLPLSTLYVLSSATIGAILIFLAVRTPLGDLFQRKAGPRLTRMQQGFKKNAWNYLLFLRFIPLLPFAVVNLTAAFLKVPLRTYVWTTIVGILPSAYVFTQAGAGFSTLFKENTAFSLDGVFNLQVKIALFTLAGLALLPIAINKMRKKSK